MRILLRTTLVRIVALAMIASSLAIPTAVMAASPSGAIPVPPTITSFSPTKGVFSGGTTVVITGTNLTGATSVKFGDDPAASFTVDSATQITAVTPSHAVGSAAVTVTRGTTAAAAAPFVFQPQISMIHDFWDQNNPGADLPFFLTQGPDGNIWASSISFGGSSSVVFKVEPNGTSTTFTPPGSIDRLTGNIVVGPDRLLYTLGASSPSSFDDLLVQINPSTGAMTPLADPTICGAVHLVLGGDGNIWITNDSVCSGDQYTIVRFSPADGSFVSYPISAHSATFQQIGMPIPLSGNRLILGVGDGVAVIVDTHNGNYSNVPVCAEDPTNLGEMMSGSMGPDGNFWMSCLVDSFGQGGNDGYLARLVLDPSDLANSTSTYYTASSTGLSIGLPFVIATGADGNLWVSQIYGITPPGSPVPWDLTGQLLRISFPNGPASPALEDFDSDVLAALYLASGADGYMYMDQFGIFAYYATLIFTNTSCTQLGSPQCEAIGIGSSTFQTLGALFKVDIGTAPPPIVDPPVVPGAGQVALSWQAPSRTGAGPITGYRIKYSTHADLSDATIIDTGDTTLARTLSSLPAGKYYVRMATTNTIGTGAYSPIILVTVPVAPAKFPTITATPGDRKVTVTYTGAGWDGGDGAGNGVGGACDCNLSYEYTADGGTSWHPASNVGASSWELPGLVNYHSYSIQLRGVNSAGTGVASDAVSVTPIAPGPATCAAGAPAQHRILTCWSTLVPSAGMTMRYRAYAFVAGTMLRVASCKGSASDTSCTINGYNKLLPNTLYDVRVRARVMVAKGQVFWSDYSSPAQVTTQP